MFCCVVYLNDPKHNITKFKHGEICCFMQGWFHLVACRYNFWWRVKISFPENVSRVKLSGKKSVERKNNVYSGETYLSMCFPERDCFQ